MDLQLAKKRYYKVGIIIDISWEIKKDRPLLLRGCSMSKDVLLLRKKVEWKYLEIEHLSEEAKLFRAISTKSRIVQI